MNTRHDAQVALVTGANKGLGFEISRQLAQQGITVVMGARSEERGSSAAEQLRQEDLDTYPVKLDVTNSADIEALPRFFQEKFGRLDILVNNAGVLLDWGVKPSDLDIDILRQTFETNVFGAFAVTKAVLPLIRESEAGRIVNVSSHLGSLTDTLDANSSYYDFLGMAYQASKSALNALTVQFSKELTDTPIKVNAATPGWVKTDLGSAEADLTPEEGADTLVWLATLTADGPTGGFFIERKTHPW
ncbi:MAG: SDR family oxidoreductase [Leptolyngbyaceae cyanobacterium MO_188.B28]|nr:SDR family oxidoreductase [Leptolyngbyaceae cyanobacterium MO_188.B28]